jgi:hypothetical protein
MTKDKLRLTPDVCESRLDAWDGTIGQLVKVANELLEEYGPGKRVIVDSGYNNVSFKIDNSDLRATQQAAWDATHPKKLPKGKLEEHKNKVILDLLKRAGVKLTKKEVNERITTGKGFDDLLGN